MWALPVCEPVRRGTIAKREPSRRDVEDPRKDLDGIDLRHTSATANASLDFRNRRLGALRQGGQCALSETRVIACQPKATAELACARRIGWGSFGHVASVAPAAPLNLGVIICSALNSGEHDVLIH